MSKQELYVVRGVVVDQSHRIAFIKLLKVLYRLEVVDQKTAIQLALEFRLFFV